MWRNNRQGVNIQIHPCSQLWFNFSRACQSCLHYGVMLPLDAGVWIMEMGKDKCNLTVQSFDFLGLVNFVWNNYGSKTTVFSCYYLLHAAISSWINHSKDWSVQIWWGLSTHLYSKWEDKGTTNRLLCIPTQRSQIRKDKLLTGERSREFHSEIGDMKSFFPFLRLFDSQ